MARALLITNPVAARADRRTPDRVTRVLTGAGIDVELVETTGAGDARELARQGVAAGMDIVAVFGGDGTTMQAAASLVGTEVALGFIPGGTGNLLAGNLRIPNDPVRAAEVLIHGRRRRIDLGRVEIAGEVHYFGVACGAGADAWVMGETAARHKRRWGMVAYAATTVRILPRLRNIAVTVTVDGHPLELRVVMLMIMNCGEIMPPFMRIRPETNPEDGLLDLLAVGADSPWQGLLSAIRVLRDGYRREVRPSPHVHYARGARFTVHAAEPLPVQFDGDPCGTTPFTAEVVPRALTVLTN